jgi:hypothetical protein
METPEMTELILNNLHPDTRTLLGVQADTPHLVDLEAIIDLVNHVHLDPTHSANLVLKYMMVLKNLYVTAKLDFELTRNKRENLHTELYKLFGSQDDSNPFYKKAKLTGAFIEAAVSESKEYQELVIQTIELDNLVTRLYHVKDVVEQQFELIKILCQNFNSIPLSGEVLSPEVMKQKLEEFTQNMVFKTADKPKSTSNFKQVEWDEDDGDGDDD